MATVCTLYRDGRPTATLTVREAADYLGVSEVTVRRMLRDGRLGHVRFGRAVRLLVEELERYLRDNRVEAAVG